MTLLIRSGGLVPLGVPLIYLVGLIVLPGLLLFIIMPCSSFLSFLTCLQ